MDLAGELKLIGSNTTDASDLLEHCKKRIVKLSEFKKSSKSLDQYVMQISTTISDQRKIHGDNFNLNKYKNRRLNNSTLKLLKADSTYLEMDVDARRIFDAMDLTEMKLARNLVRDSVDGKIGVIKKRYAKYLERGVHADFMTNEEKRAILKNNPGNQDLIEQTNKVYEHVITRSDARHEKVTTKMALGYAKLNKISLKLREKDPIIQSACFDYMEAISFRKSLKAAKAVEERLKEEKKLHAKMSREKLKKRKENREKRLEVLKAVVPDSCLQSQNSFDSEFNSRFTDIHSYTEKRNFLSKAMSRVKETCKEEAKQNPDIKPPKELTPTRIINENKGNHEKCLKALQRGVHRLIKWRLYDWHCGFTFDRMESTDENQIFKVFDKRHDPKTGIQKFKKMHWDQAQDYLK